MWLIYSIGSIILFAFCEIYEKKGANQDEPYSEVKMLVWFGIFALVVSVFISVTGLRETKIGILGMLTQNPAILLAAVFYFLSLLFAFISLTLIPVSIESPITNSSGALCFIGAVVLYAIMGKYEVLAQEVTPLKWILVAVMCSTVIVFSVMSHSGTAGNAKTRAAAVFGILFAGLSAVCDAGNSVVIYYILADYADSNDYLFASNLLFAAMGAIAWIYVSVRIGKAYNPFGGNQRDKAIGALLDCAGMVTCVLAVSYNPFFADPIISTYFVFTAVLSRFLLKEKLTVKQWLCIFILVAGLCAFAVLDA